MVAPHRLHQGPGLQAPHMVNVPHARGRREASVGRHRDVVHALLLAVEGHQHAAVARVPELDLRAVFEGHQHARPVGAEGHGVHGRSGVRGVREGGAVGRTPPAQVPVGRHGREAGAVGRERDAPHRRGARPQAHPRGARCRASQTTTVPSLPPEAASAPSAVMATARISAACPRITRKSSPASASHSRTVASSPPDSKSRPSGDMASAITARWCPSCGTRLTPRRATRQPHSGPRGSPPASARRASRAASSNVASRRGRCSRRGP